MTENLNYSDLLARINDDFRNKDLQKIVNKTRKWMMKFDPEILFFHLHFLLSNPENAKIQFRLELLFRIFMNLEESHFKNNSTDKYNIDKNIKKFLKKDKIFLFYEDWTPFDQSNYIPFVIDQKIYRFYFGLNSRPYEVLTQIKNLYLIHKADTSFILSNFKNLFLKSLDFQSNLLNFFEKQGKYIENCKLQENAQLLNQFIKIISIDEEDIQNSKEILELGKCNEIITKGTISEDPIYSSLFLKIKNRLYIIPPQFHLKSILEKSYRIPSQLNSQETEIYTKNIFQSIIIPFGNKFSKCGILNSSILHSILNLQDICYPEYLLKTELYGICVSFVKYHDIDKMDSKLELIYQGYQKIKENIHKIDEAIKQSQQNKSNNSISSSQIFQFVIYERTDVDMINIHSKYSDSFFVIKLLDFLACINFLPKFEHFINIFELSTKQTKKFMYFEFSNILSYFLENNYGFHHSGEKDLMMFLNPHGWYYFFHEKLKHKYKNRYWEKNEVRFPDPFYRITNLDGNDNIFYVNSYNSKEFLCMVYINNFYFVIKAYDDYNEKNKPIVDNFIEIFKFTINDNKHLLEKLFLNYSLKLNYCLFIQINYSEDDICNTQLKIEELNPIQFVEHKIVNDECYALLEINLIDWVMQFEKETQNSDEKLIIKTILDCIVDSELKNRAKLENSFKIGKFIDDYFKIQKKRFFFNLKMDENPLRLQYEPFFRISNYHISKVNQIVDDYIGNLKLKSQILDIDHSVSMYNQIYQQIHAIFSSELKKCNLAFVIFCYKQLEFIEAERKNLQISIGTLEYLEEVNKNDERVHQLLYEIPLYSVATRFILVTKLKQGFSEKARKNYSNYGFILALSQRLIYFSQKLKKSSLRIKSSLIEIKDLFVFSENEKEGEFNEIAYKKKIERTIWDTYKSDLLSKEDLYNSSDSGVFNGDSSDISPSEVKINNSFQKTYQVDFNSFISILILIGNYDNDYSFVDFPIVKINENDLTKKLVGYYYKTYNKAIAEEKIKKILNILSLTNESFENVEIYDRNDLLKVDRRISLRPLIKISKIDLIFGIQTCQKSLEVWLHYITSGIRPFALEDSTYLAQTLKDIHQSSDKEFEIASINECRQVLGENNVIGNLKKFKSINSQSKIQLDCGEIDIVAINKQKKILFILDAKNLSITIDSSKWDNQFKKFAKNKKKTYLHKLLNKRDFVEKYITDFLKYFGINDYSNWNIKMGFVLSNLIQPMFSYKKEVDFIYFNDLEKYLLNY
jgi:hypothetical protein